MRKIYIVPALLGCLTQACFAQANRQDTIITVTPIFSQLLRLTVPKNFTVGTSSLQPNNYLQELILNNDSKNRWSDMITITGIKGLSANPKATPTAILQSFEAGFRKSCPTTFSSRLLFEGSVSVVHPAVFTVISCGESPTTNKETSEAALIGVISGAKDVYTVQWALRGPVSHKPIAISPDDWRQRLDSLKSLVLCDRVPGEDAPFPSCMNTK